MKALHYGALVKPSVARALADQVNATLGPVLVYLKQIIHTERERQRRYPMKWERVREPYVLQLEPRDSVVELQAPPPALRVTNWPEGRALPGKDVPLIVVRSRSSEQLSVLECAPSPAGPLVTAEQPPLPTDLVFWDGVQCVLAPTEPPRVPHVLLDTQGRTWPVRRVFEGKGPLSWRLILEGRLEEPLQLAQPSWKATLVDPLGGLRSLEDGEGLQVPFEGPLELRVDTPPAEGLLVGNNGVRFSWEQKDRRQGRGSGIWIQLLSARPTDEESTVDPRTFFCEDGVDEVWTDTSRKDSGVYKVRDARREQYRLRLDRLPPEDSTLYLPVGNNPKVQRRAALQLKDSPLPHHRGLLRLTEDPRRARSERPGWERVPWDQEPLEPARVDTWRILTDPARSGTDQQRAFVQCALGTSEFAFLEGPPGSGKTTAICELVLQLIERKKTILLCATTHFAIDNVLERLTGLYPEVEAVRLGRTDKVDPRVRNCQLDERVQALLTAWRGAPGLSGRGDGELKAMAERVVLASANLTCATTMGIGAHPFLRAEGQSGGEREERPHTRGAHFDVLIIDEASKTTLQEFLVPALLARRWIIVGDVRQLPPFTERADLEANLRSPVDENERPVFPEAHQRACLLRYRLLLRRPYREQVRWLLVEEPAVLEMLQKEAAADPEVPEGFLVRVVLRRSGAERQTSHLVTVDELERGAPEALRLSAAQWVLVEPALLARVERYLPSNLLSPREGSAPAGTAFGHRQAHWLARAHPLPEPFQERGQRIGHPREAQTQEREFLGERSWAKEVAWRLTRVHELRRSRDQDEVKRLGRQLDVLLPRVGREPVREHMDLLADISLPSVLESLQLGVRFDNPRRRSYLLQGLGPAWKARAVCLTHQHRMHADISAFPRTVFYEDAFLKDEPPGEAGDETVARRDAKHGWSFGTKLPSRRLWVDVEGRDVKGTNQAEVEAMRDVIRRFLAWAEKHPHAKANDGKRWEVACLSFYVRQEAALRDMLQKVTGTEDKHTHRFDAGNAELVCGTVDRFQGREADLVLLSMRNTSRVGFLDSPNRLNVGLTRARRLLLVFGHRHYFSRCDVGELERLAKESVSRTPRNLLERMDG
ncbi:AAA domain-containing protein [Archangium gephyra]|uniref:AAA domain-containing protein n=1 Tax=Archangium gephyra TaxID=48 RepID=A0AAC8Q7I6_9BACT|nr:DEAD/DEAH box helicase [Archangium gephyra]AKJ02434.1 DNA helicase [Archangium gephyra]REG28639.1 AAA domain-containing protein [Archangium gephyra]